MCWLLLENDKFWVYDPGWKRVSPWFQKLNMPVVIMFATVYHWWSSNNSFTGWPLIVLRSKVAVSGLLKQVKEKPFSKKPQLCWCVLSLWTFLFCFLFYVSPECQGLAAGHDSWILWDCAANPVGFAAWLMHLHLLITWSQQAVLPPGLHFSTYWQGSEYDFSPL